MAQRKAGAPKYPYCHAFPSNTYPLLHPLYFNRMLPEPSSGRCKEFFVFLAVQPEMKIDKLVVIVLVEHRCIRMEVCRVGASYRLPRYFVVNA